MKPLLFFMLLITSITSCKKEAGNDQVEIYRLKSFQLSFDTSSNPGVSRITEAVMENTPLVQNNHIRYYTRATGTFTLGVDIQSLIKDFGPDQGFAVTVNREPVYYGMFHPAYLSSIRFGLATIDPILSQGNELTMNFFLLTGNPELEKADKRNEERLLNALATTGRLR